MDDKIKSYEAVWNNVCEDANLLGYLAENPDCVKYQFNKWHQKAWFWRVSPLHYEEADSLRDALQSVMNHDDTLPGHNE